MHTYTHTYINGQLLCVFVNWNKVYVCMCDTSEGSIVFFVASRGHHADVGGIAPGSMPPLSKVLFLLDRTLHV